MLFFSFFVLTALAVKREAGGSVFFRQKRCTKDGRVFKMVKFRSMAVDAEKDGAAPCTGKDLRITKTGKVISAARLDELPQFAYRLRVKGCLTGYKTEA